MMEGWLNKKQVGEYLGGKSPRTVDRWVAKRIIPQGKRFPGGMFWKKEVLDRWLSDSNYEKRCDKQLRLRNAAP